MISELKRELRRIETGTRADAWEAAKLITEATTELMSELLRLLAEAEGPENRAAAAHALGFGRFAIARQPLESCLANRSEPSLVRGHAAEALGYIGSRQSVPILVRHLEDPDVTVRYWCAFALASIGDKEAIPALRRMAENAHEEMYNGSSLRAEALEAIVAIESTDHRNE